MSSSKQRRSCCRWCFVGAAAALTSLASASLRSLNVASIRRAGGGRSGRQEAANRERRRAPRWCGLAWRAPPARSLKSLKCCSEKRIVQVPALRQVQPTGLWHATCARCDAGACSQHPAAARSLWRAAVRASHVIIYVSFCDPARLIGRGAQSAAMRSATVLRIRLRVKRLAPTVLTLPRALRDGFWWSARLVKGASRAWACLRGGAAVSGSARRRRRGAGQQRHFWRAVGVCALAPATRALLRCLAGRLCLAGTAWARPARGSWRP